MLGAYVCSLGCQGIYFLLIARMLQASEYGVFAGALALVTVMTAFTGVGAGSVMVMRVSRDRSEYAVQYGTAMVYVLVSAVPLVGLAAIAGYSSSASLGQVVLILSISELIFSSLLDLGYQVNQAHDKLRRTALFMCTTALLRLLAVISFGYLYPATPTASAWALVYGGVSVVMGVTISIYCVKRYDRPRVSRCSLITTWRSGIWFAFGMSARTTYVDADKFFLARYAPGQDSTGAYAIASRVATFATVPVQALVYSMNTTLFRAGQHGFDSSWKAIRKPSILVVAYGVGAAVLMGIISPALPMVLGSSFGEAASVVLFLCLLPLFQGVNYLFGDALMGIGQQRNRALLQGCSAVIAVVLNVCLVPELGWVGAAVSTMAATVLLASTLVTCFVLGLARERAAVRRQQRRSLNSYEHLDRKVGRHAR